MKHSLSSCLAVGLVLLAVACSSDPPRPDDSTDAPGSAQDARVRAAPEAGAPRKGGGSEPLPEDGEEALPSSDPGWPATGDAGDTASGARPDARVVDSSLPTDAGTSSGAGMSDDIYGTRVPRSDAWWVQDGRIYRGAHEVRLFGLNWFGLETEARALFGPSQAQRSVADFLSQLKSLGFNALRVPLSPESIDPGFASADWAVRGQLDTGREHFEELAAAAQQAGLFMLWDIHTCASSVGFMKKSPLDPACVGYGREKWIANLTTLAKLAKSYAPAVLGIDLFNEPYGLTWSDWKNLADEGGRAVLRENPNILVFVEGVGSEGYGGSEAVFWGENLSAATSDPLSLPSSRLVFSPHVYGPSVYDQPYFAEAGFPENMPAIWDRHFGSLFRGSQPVVLGEFGGRYSDADKVWQDRFVRYLRDRGARSFFYWCLNPNSGDTGGLLRDDWRSVDMAKLDLLAPLMQ